MQAYELNSIDFQFENKLRMGEIQKFAENAVPQPRFLFDNFKVDPNDLNQAADSEEESDLSDAEQALDTDKEDSASGYKDNDYFSFFSSHQSIILKPESSFKSLQGFLTHMPIDYYVLFANEDTWGQTAETKEKTGVFDTTNYIIFDNLPLF